MVESLTPASLSFTMTSSAADIKFRIVQREEFRTRQHIITTASLSKLELPSRYQTRQKGTLKCSTDVKTSRNQAV